MNNYTPEDLVVRNTLRTHGPLMRQELSDRTKLLPVSLELAIERLMMRGEVIQSYGWLGLAGVAGATKTTDPTQPEPSFGKIYDQARQVYLSQACLDAQGSHLGSQVLPSAPTPTEIRDEAVFALNRLIQAHNALLERTKHYDALLADREALHALRAKLRGLADE